ncbi:hypothetical protein [Tolumonas lignilytica]|jgi:hypothetical protein|uniref:hypothetical protein n=1 Tax=Tolumonas lignilytica TaxID=1283284 RepID=UPI00046787ED|nr:hypothetical protein [Tolumonas lignilytica]
MLKPIAGILLFGMWVGYLGHLFLGMTPWPAVVLAWGAALLLGPRLDKAARRQCLILYSAAGLLLLFCWMQGVQFTAAQLLQPNMDMVALFTAVSTLNLATSALAENEQSNWKGWRGLFSSLFGVSFLGAVINMSVLFVVGDRLAVNGTLERRQVIILNRIYCAAAYWSPFFIAMAVALAYAPGMQFSRILPFGLLAALGAMAITIWDVWRIGIHDFEGYPLRLQTLKLPILLSLAVLLGKWWWPDLSITGVIALMAPLISVLLMPKQQMGNALKRQVTERFPSMGSQVVLFLGAGLLAAGIHGLTQIWSPEILFAHVTHYGVFEASVVTLVILVIAYLGVHPIIMTSSLAPLLWHLHPDPSLLGMTFLFSWGLSTGATPLSGANLALIACFRVRAWNMLIWNLGYAIKEWVWLMALYALYVRCYL